MGKHDGIDGPGILASRGEWDDARNPFLVMDARELFFCTAASRVPEFLSDLAAAPLRALASAREHDGADSRHFHALDSEGDSVMSPDCGERHQRGESNVDPLTSAFRSAPVVPLRWTSLEVRARGGRRELLEPITLELRDWATRWKLAAGSTDRGDTPIDEKGWTDWLLDRALYQLHRWYEHPNELSPIPEVVNRGVLTDLGPEPRRQQLMIEVFPWAPQFEPASAFRARVVAAGCALAESIIDQTQVQLKQDPYIKKRAKTREIEKHTSWLVMHQVEKQRFVDIATRAGLRRPGTAGRNTVDKAVRALAERLGLPIRTTKSRSRP